LQQELIIDLQYSKTQILLRYGFKRCQSALSTSVFWVSASSCSAFRKSYNDIAAKLKLLNGREDAYPDVLQLVKETLESKGLGEWILIVDIADDLPNLFIDHPDGRKKLLSYLPENSPNPILYSTRSKAVARQLVASGGIISVQPLSPSDSASILSDKLKSEGIPSTVGEGYAHLLHELEYLPLAIVQAASYITENSWTVPECLQHYRADKSAQMLKHEFRDTTREEQRSSGEETDQGPPNAVAPMFTTILSQIESQDPYAAELLRLMAVYGTRYIPKEILQETQDVENHVRFGKSIGTLTAFSLVAIKEEGKSFKVHRLVQRSIRDWLVCHDQFKPWFNKGITMISKRFPGQLDTDEDVARAIELICHIRLEAHLITDPGDEKEAVCELLMNCSTFHGCTEQLEMCMKTGQLAYDFAILHMLEDPLAEANTSYVMAKALFTHGKYDEAREKCETAGHIYSDKFGYEGKFTQDVFHLIGAIHYARGQYMEAFKLQTNVLNTAKTKFSVDEAYEQGKFTAMALSYAAVLHNLIMPYDPKQYDDRVLQDVLNWTIEHKGAESRAARLAMTDLASSLVRGDLDRAWDLNEKVLSLKGEPLDPNDPPTRQNLVIRTLVLYGHNQNTEAERWARVVLESSEKALGPKHPKTLEHVWLLALVVIAQEKWGEAEEFAGRAYEAYTELYGPDDQWTLDCRMVLEVALHKQHRWGYHWVDLKKGFGLWQRKPYHPLDEYNAQDVRVRVATVLPYVMRRYHIHGVEVTEEDVEAWRNYSLIRRLPRRDFSGYVTATLYQDDLRLFLIRTGDNDSMNEFRLRNLNS